MLSTSVTTSRPTSRPRVPETYQIPPFPSLYWPFRVPKESQTQHYLYNIPEIWRFTLMWTLIVYAIVYMTAGFWAVSMQIVSGTRRRWGDQRLGGNRNQSKGKKRSVADTGDPNNSSRANNDPASDSTGHPNRPRRRPRSGRNGGWLIWLIPLVYALIAGLEAVISGTVVGLMLGAVYQAGFFKMSTWIPFIWALIMAFVLIVSSFSMQGGL